MMKIKQDNDMVDRIGVIYVFILLNYHAQSDRVPIMTNHTNAVYIENKTKLSWPIRSGPICDEN